MTTTTREIEQGGHVEVMKGPWAGCRGTVTLLQWTELLDHSLVRSAFVRLDGEPVDQ